jgi:hypothetical protein
VLARAAHVEADRVVEPACGRDLGGGPHPARRTGQQERGRRTHALGHGDQTAGRRHGEHVRRELRELIEVRRAHGFEVRLDHGGHHAFVLAELRADLVRAHDELRTHRPECGRDLALVPAVEIRVQ